mgnify:FL=1
MKPTYAEQIGAEISRSRKQRDSARLFYYTEALNYSAMAGWDTFRKSWAGEQWLARNAARIERFRDEQNTRFAYLGAWT